MAAAVLQIARDGETQGKVFELAGPKVRLFTSLLLAALSYCAALFVYKASVYLY